MVSGQELDVFADPVELPRELRDVAARAERPAAPGKNETSDIRILIARDHPLMEISHHRNREGVQRLGTIQGERRDPVSDRKSDQIRRHHPFPSAPRSSYRGALATLYYPMSRLHLGLV